MIASIVRFASLVILANESNTNITSELTHASKQFHRKSTDKELENWSLMAGATIVEVYIAIIGACVVTLGPVYRRLRYGHPQGSSKSRHLEGSSGTQLESRARGSKIMGRIVARRRNSFELLDQEIDSQTRIMVGETSKTPPLTGIMVERDVEWTESQPVPEATSAARSYGWSQI